jgi:hypothetical protein
MPRPYLRRAIITENGVEYSRRGGNFLPPEMIARVRDRLLSGEGSRPIAAELGISKATVWRYRGQMVAEGTELRCACGAPAGHRGWCSVRLSKSEARQEFLKRWARWKAPALVRASSLDRRVVLAYPYIGQGTINNSDLLTAINALVPHWLPDHLRADVAQEMIVDVLTGVLSLEHAGASVRRYLSHVNADRYKLVSLDAPVRGTDNLRLLDTIESTRFHI